jgi:hypothetical protein
MSEVGADSDVVGMRGSLSCVDEGSNIPKGGRDGHFLCHGTRRPNGP